MIQPWLITLDSYSLRYQEKFSDLDERQLNWKPSPTSWSIAQVLDHLIKTNESYYPVLEDAVNGKLHVPAISRIPFVYKAFGKLILGFVEPERKRKIKTMMVWEPGSSTIPGDIVNRFIHHQDELKAKIRKHQFLFERNPVISSPANKYISYTLQTAIDIILAHELRHFNQAVEIAELQKQSILVKV